MWTPERFRIGRMATDSRTLATSGWPSLSNGLYCQVFHKSVRSPMMNPEVSFAYRGFPSVPTITSKVTAKSSRPWFGYTCVNWTSRANTVFSGLRFEDLDSEPGILGKSKRQTKNKPKHSPPQSSVHVVDCSLAISNKQRRLFT